MKTRAALSQKKTCQNQSKSLPSKTLTTTLDSIKLEQSKIPEWTI